MAFTSLKILFFSKKNKYYLILPFFVCLLRSFINERSLNIKSVFRKGANEHILRAKIWLYGFESVFWQVLIDFWFVVYLILNRLFVFNRIEYRQFLIPFDRCVGFFKQNG